MTPDAKKRRKPPITLSHSDHGRLTRLAQSIAERNPAIADTLQSELERARIVPDARLGGNVVRIGSTLRYATDMGETRTVTLVLPPEADISAGRISVLTPIGAALIGLSPGQSIDWETRDGRVGRLTVESVETMTTGLRRAS
jgi:regulator of nucleoside diphosphate kinase